MHCLLNTNKLQDQNVFRLFHTHHMHMLAIWAFLQTELKDFPINLSFIRK